MPRPKVTHCKRGHEISVVGRNEGGTCRACNRLGTAKWQVDNPEKVRTYHKSYYATAEWKAYFKVRNATPEARARQKAYGASPEGRARDNIYRRDYYKQHCITGHPYKIAKRLRTRLYIAIRNQQKTGSAVRDLGCSIPELIDYFIPLFQEGMSWENHGEWHIDHIVPLTAFDLEDREQLLKACHFTNLQPLWAIDNIRKGGVRRSEK